MNETEIYVELLDEGATVFGLVPAIHLGKRFYKIIKSDRLDYKPKFGEGIYVMCLMSQFEEGKNLFPVAYCEVSKEEAEYLAKSK